MNKVNAFYMNAVLPEVLCKWYSRQRMATVDESETQPNAVSGRSYTDNSSLWRF